MNPPVADSISDLVWSVTAEDIARAVPRDPQRCAQARGVQRAIGCSEEDVRIGQDIVHVRMPIDRETARAPRNRHLGLHEGDVVWIRYRSSAKLNRAIGAFDREVKPFAPGVYRFRAITPSQTLAAKADRSRKTKRPGTRGPIAPRQWARPRVPLGRQEVAMG